MLDKDPFSMAQDLFNSSLRRKLEEYDAKVRKKFQIGLILTVVGGAGLLLGLKAGEVVLCIGAVLGIAGICVLVNAAGDKRGFFRYTVLPEVLSAIDPDLVYDPEKGLYRGKFDCLDIFNGYDRYSSEDRITGFVGKTAIEASEVHIEKRHRDKDGKTSYTTLFRGVVFIADFNKHINCRTAVLPDLAERCFGKLIGNFFQQLNFSEGSLVKLENPEFEKFFAVYSDDQIEARYILTPAIMEQLVKLRQAENNDVWVVFEDTYAAVLLKRSSGWLEPPIWGKLARVEVLERVFGEMLRVLKLVELLDLNTRIWTKK